MFNKIRKPVTKFVEFLKEHFESGAITEEEVRKWMTLTSNERICIMEECMKQQQNKK